MKKEWFLDRYCGQQFAAYLEDGKLIEFSAENEPRTGIVGNIYKGKVVNVLSGMNAAFINCGLSRNCYLCAEDTYADCAKYDGALGSLNAQPLDLKEGDEVIVQVTKPARGNKGAKVSTHLSFVGKRIIYLPQTSFLGISRKITDEHLRDTLLKMAENMRENHNEGFIFRTQAPFATHEELKTEVAYLKKLYLETIQAAENAPIGAILHEDEDLPARVMRDSFGDDITAIHVGDVELYQRLSHLANLRGNFPTQKLMLYQGERSMLKEYGITPLIYDAACPVVPLENGAHIVIEHTEAMTVVDVNTGSYVGKNNLEDTVFAVNLAAAREIARQVRLRNIGGIIVVDFIDMALPEHRYAVTEELKNLLALDNAKCNVLPMSELCLTQFTRKRVGHNALSYLEKPCPHCAGKGYVHEDIYVMTRIRAEILDRFADGYTTAVIELNDGIMRKIFNERIFAHETANRWKEKRIYLIPHKTYREDCFTVRGETADELELPNNAQLLSYPLQ